MKTRKTLIAILVIALLVVYYVIGTDYLRQRREQAATASHIAAAAANLAQLPAPPTDLEERLADAEARREAARGLLPDTMSSTRIVNTVLRLSEESRVKAIPLITQPWETEGLGDHGYAVFRLNVAVTGSFNQLLDFLRKLEGGEMPTLTVEDTRVTAEFQPGVERLFGVEPVSATLSLAVYTQPPAAEQP